MKFQEALLRFGAKIALMTLAEYATVEDLKDLTFAQSSRLFRDEEMTEPAKALLIEHIKKMTPEVHPHEVAKLGTDQLGVDLTALEKQVELARRTNKPADWLKLYSVSAGTPFHEEVEETLVAIVRRTRQMRRGVFLQETYSAGEPGSKLRIAAEKQLVETAHYCDQFLRILYFSERGSSLREAILQKIYNDRSGSDHWYWERLLRVSGDADLNRLRRHAAKKLFEFKAPLNYLIIAWELLPKKSRDAALKQIAERAESGTNRDQDIYQRFLKANNLQLPEKG